MPEQTAATTPAEITLYDKVPRVLRYSNKALKKIKLEFGVSVLREGAGRLFEIVDEEKLPLLLRLGLDHKYEGGTPGITEDDIDEIIDAQNAPYACQQLFVALGNSILKNALDVVKAAMATMAEKPVVAPRPPPQVETAKTVM